MTTGYATGYEPLYLDGMMEIVSPWNRLRALEQATSPWTSGYESLDLDGVTKAFQRVHGEFRDLLRRVEG